MFFLAGFISGCVAAVAYIRSSEWRERLAQTILANASRIDTFLFRAEGSKSDDNPYDFEVTSAFVICTDGDETTISSADVEKKVDVTDELQALLEEEKGCSISVKDFVKSGFNSEILNRRYTYLWVTYNAYNSPFEVVYTIDSEALDGDTEKEIFPPYCEEEYPTHMRSRTSMRGGGIRLGSAVSLNKPGEEGVDVSPAAKSLSGPLGDFYSKKGLSMHPIWVVVDELVSYNPRYIILRDNHGAETSYDLKERKHISFPSEHDVCMSLSDDE